ncbi:TPA: ABC transporter permease, partial [Clostridioides difficile]|nr:ABC transporter permease [Clostridioides difficile]EGT5236928.1 ABC transporter permease [Clostridioides difficile]HCP7047384.1 ABC transporter permease [Clostridioides difficile]
MGVIIMRNKDIPGLIFSQEINVPLAFLCICIWSIVSVLFASIALGRRK